MKNHQYIVAIGASAGGLEALSSFFDHTPMDSVSYVIIPHLSVNFKSRMIEILARHSSLEVIEAEEAMPVEVNKVYLIPNTKYMGIKDGKLFLAEKEGHTLPHMTIDSFFSALAEERGMKAIGVILSGVGSDGSKGAVKIEKAGGVVMVQTPSDAKFDGMPLSAIAACNSSYIDSAAALPMIIQDYIGNETGIGIEDEATFNEDVLIETVNLIKEYYPFDFTNYKIGTLIRRIRRRMLYHNIDNEMDFLEFLQRHPEDMELLIGDFLIGVTSFFRDPEAFELLEEQVFPTIIENKSGNEFLKIWVACCATGEEAYSLAILVKEYLIKNKKDLEVKIFATDINKKALDHAAKGIFSGSIQKSVSPERLQNFFDKSEDFYKVKPEIREMLIFARHDLTKNPPYCHVDLISCRNMLIYIKPVLQKQILSKLSFGLRKNGYLFLGSSENLSIAKNEFLEVSSKWKIYQSTQTSRMFNLDGQLSAPISDLTDRRPQKITVRKELTQPPGLSLNLTEVILTESGFCGVNIDRDGNVIQAFGDLTPYLKQERFVLSLKELLPEELYIAFGTSVQKVLKLNQRIRINDIQFTGPDTGKRSRTDMVICPYLDGRTKMEGMLVLFKEVSSIPSADSPGVDFKIDIQTKEYIAQLEEDLMNSRLDLQSSGEFLESSKEAMQAFNEELLSANEEMQSANEELQSINEELEAVNTAHKYSINELTILNDDLNNYFRSNTNGQLFVDKDILLKKYSPGAIKHINIRESDIGRPLSNITVNIKLDTLVNDVKKVIEDGEVIMREVESMDGKFYQVTTSPYLQNYEKEISGAIITFYEITNLKKIQLELFKSTETLRLATDAAEMATWSINNKTRKLTGSPRLYEMFGFDPQTIISIDDIVSQIENQQRTEVLETIDNSILHGQRFEIEFQIQGPDNKGLRWIKAIGNLTHDSEILPGELTGIMEDVTSHKLNDLRKNDFIAIVSHELKSPLTSVQGYLQILLSKAQNIQDTFSLGILEKTARQVKKMTGLINGFLDLSRLEAGQIHLDKEHFKIGQLINEIVDDVTISNSGRLLTISADDELLIYADRDKIGQVITNLISNAIKYSPAGTNIDIICKRSENSAELSIKDQGMGIKTGEQKKLFDRYYRIEDNHTKSISGFGIGLYLCSEIIKRHQGKIWVESEYGKGSVFWCSIPLNA